MHVHKTYSKKRKKQNMKTNKIFEFFGLNKSWAGVVNPWKKRKDKRNDYTDSAKVFVNVKKVKLVKNPR